MSIHYGGNVPTTPGNEKNIKIKINLYMTFVDVEKMIHKELIW